MALSRRRFISITAGVTLSGMAMTQAQAKVITWNGVALGAVAQLVIAGLPKTEADRLISLARNEIIRLENIFSIYQQDSAVAKLNETGELRFPAPELLTLFSMVDVIHKASSGMFDPSIQPLWRTYAEHNGKPPKAAIKQTTELVGWHNIDVNSSGIKFQKLEMAITLNGIAQGYITDRIVQLLKAEGLSSAVVKMGEISAIGNDANNKAWQIGIANVGDEPAEDHVSLKDQSIATSSTSGTTFDGKVSHIIDPTTGIPAQSNWQRVSVIHKSAAMADGISTAAILMDEKQIEAMLKETSNIRLYTKNSSGKTNIFES